MSDNRVLFVDFETYYDSKAKYGLKELSVTEYVRDERFKAHGLSYAYEDGDAHWISGDHVLEAWVKSIDWSNTTVCSHNVKFDGAILAWLYGVKPALWFDTVALAKATLGNYVPGYSLGVLADYLGLQAKGELKWDGMVREEWLEDRLFRTSLGDKIVTYPSRIITPQDEAEMAVYCKGDTLICRGIYEKLISQFPKGQIQAVDWTVRAFLEPRLVLDSTALSAGVLAEKARREALIAASGIDRKVLSSNKQFAELLEKRGITVRTKVSARTRKAIPAFAKTDEGLETVKQADPVLYAARIASKANLLETRGESLLSVAKTGLFPFDVGFSGAVQTHRYSGGSGAGGNPQNFTRDSFLRRSVCAPEGYSLIVGDFAAIELRVLSWLAREPKLINAIIGGVDIYLDYGSDFFGRTLNKKEHAPERHFSKGAILGLGYQMGADKFFATVKALKPAPSFTPEQIQALEVLIQKFTIEDAQASVRLYRDKFFNIPKLWEMCAQAIPLIANGRISCLHFAPFIKVQKNAIVLPSGLKLQYPNLRGIKVIKFGRPHTEWVYDVFVTKGQAEPRKLYGGKLVENICQALAGELFKEAVTRAEQAGLTCVGGVHDEILALSRVPENGVELLKQCMEQSPKWWSEIHLVAEVGHGGNWADAKH